MYNEEIKTENVHIDLDDIPPNTFFREYQNAIEQVLNLVDMNNQSPKALLATKNHYTSTYGFRFLNSDFYIQQSDNVNIAIENELKKQSMIDQIEPISNGKNIIIGVGMKC